MRSYSYVHLLRRIVTPYFTKFCEFLQKFCDLARKATKKAGPDRPGLFFIATSLQTRPADLKNDLPHTCGNRATGVA
jgi:hypothetical protein